VVVTKDCAVMSLPCGSGFSQYQLESPPGPVEMYADAASGRKKTQVRSTIRAT